jgi:hypothetical protein
MTHRDTFSVFTVRARVCTRTGKTVTMCHVSFAGNISRPKRPEGTSPAPQSLLPIQRELVFHAVRVDNALRLVRLGRKRRVVGEGVVYR